MVNDGAAMQAYRFEGVEVDAAAHRLVVDGNERACSRRALLLLAMLCESPGRLLARQEIADRLWPGGQIVSDESIGQIIFRARALLGAHAARITTVRGVGIRLDATVERIDAGAPAQPAPLAAGEDEAFEGSTEMPPLSPSAGAAPLAGTALADGTPARPGVARGKRWWAACALLLLACAGLWWRQAGSDDWLDRGFALREADARSSRPETLRLLHQAFDIDAQQSDTARVAKLMAAAHAADTQSPLPALMAAYFEALRLRYREADEWLKAFEQRRRLPDDAYLDALATVVGGMQGVVRAGMPGVNEQLASVGAALAIRPQAYRLSLQQARLYMYRGQPQAGLQALQQASLDPDAPRAFQSLIAMRASLGDVAGARELWKQRARGDEDPVQAAVLEGRLAYSAGDFADAIAHFERAEKAAHARGHPTFLWIANLAFAQVYAGDMAASRTRLERARVAAVDAGIDYLAADIDAVLAQLLHSAGDAGSVDAMRRCLDAARRIDDPEFLAVASALALRLGVESQLPEPPDIWPGGQLLVRARNALARGDRGAALAAFRQARLEGVADAGPIAWEYAVLAADLDEPLPELPRVIEPPEWPVWRLAGALALTARAADAPGKPDAP